MKTTLLLPTLLLCFLSTHLCHAQTPAFTLYGLTIQGGTYMDGTIFQWPIGGGLFKSDHDFAGNPDGSSPWGSLVLANNGLLYGLTKAGGTGLGTIFSFDPSNNNEVVLHKFANNGDGAAPYGSFIQAKNGLLYAMTTGGGVNGTGSIISFNPANDSEQVLYSFNNGTGDGQYPYSSLIQAKDTLLYGMTQRGGTNDSGIIFSFNISTGVETKLHDFGNGPDAAYPSGSLMQASDGLLYGMSYAGGIINAGTIFSYNISTGRDSVLHSFSMDSIDGRYPYGSLIQANNGLLYGLTGSGGRKMDGMMFSFNTTTSAFKDIHDFGSIYQDGVRPDGTLLQATDGNLYGMTAAGGSGFDGIVFSYGITDSSYNLLNFTGFNGYLPYYGALIEVGNYTAPVLVHGPAAVTTCANDSASFSAAATGNGITEQWQVSTDQGNTYNDVTGAVDSIYSLLATGAQSGNLYRAILSNPAGADTTGPASLQVTSVDTIAGVNGPVCTASQPNATYQWVDCNTGQHISGATSQSYTATANGNYKCILTWSGCTDTTFCVTVTGVGLTDLVANTFTLYPNPFTDQLNITLGQQNIQQAAFTITDLLGQTLYTRQESNISANYTSKLDLSNLPDGVYLMNVVVDGEKIVKELVKQ